MAEPQAPEVNRYDGLCIHGPGSPDRCGHPDCVGARWTRPTTPGMNRWERHAEQGKCVYCGARRLVQPDPFGQGDACQPCWEQIAYGDDDE